MRLLAAAGLALLAMAPARAADDTAFVAWARANASPLSLCTGLDAAGRAIGDAPVVALGEPVHGGHEPLAFRNCLFRYLVEERSFTAIALETGLSESRALDNYVAGGGGTVRDVARQGFTWGFWRFPENIELLDWIRAYNADPRHGRKIRIYGIDMSGGEASGEWRNARRTLDGSMAFLARAAPSESMGLRGRLASFAGRFNLTGYRELPAGERARLRSAIGELGAFFDAHRAALIAAASQADYDWARQNAVAARQLETLFAVSGRPDPDGNLSPGDYKSDAARDAAMAANVRWVIDRERAGGRVLVFAHNGHVMNGRTRGGIWSVYTRAPAAMGEHLRVALGRKLVIIGTSGSVRGVASERKPATLDAALAKVGADHFLLDFRQPDGPAARSWLRRTQSLQVNSSTENLIVPARAFDAMVFFGTVSPVQRLDDGG
ncbi:erythromycin esterase family protein [Sphingopyxis sp. J-6]|uniref:erythromycin esterase family protein n=1 Tax=Sphingopyxis sp. J-6 TaxID=3122054 RepID=UPI003983E99F